MTETSMVVTTLVLGLVAGVLSGMFGIGGGLIIVPGLILIFQTPPKTAVGTSLFALMWPVGLLGVIEYHKSGQLLVKQGMVIAIGLFFGAYFGARITLAISTSTMKRLYAIFLLVVGVYFLYTTRDRVPPRETAPAVPPRVGEGDAQVH